MKYVLETWFFHPGPRPSLMFLINQKNEVCFGNLIFSVLFFLINKKRWNMFWKPDFFILVLDQVLQLGNGVFPVKNLPKVFLQLDFCPKPLCGNEILPKTLVWKWKSEKNTFGNGPGFFSMSPHWTRRREEMFFEIFELNSSIIKILSAAESYCWKNSII